MRSPPVLLFLLVISSVSAATWPKWVSGTKYDYNDANNVGEGKCALINVAVDESGSMATEQSFLRDTALSKIAEKLYTTRGYDHVFLSSNGYGSKYVVTTDPAWFRHLGTSRFNDFSPFALQDPTIVNWVNKGSREDGYHALRSSMYWMPLVVSNYNLYETCATIDRNLILVTDEDRDAENRGADLQEIQKWMAARKYILNIVIPIEILLGAQVTTDSSKVNNLGAQVTTDSSKVFIADGSGNWTSELMEQPFDEIAANSFEWDTFGHTAFEHYVPLIANTNGAVWCVNSLRRGIRESDKNLALSFANAFVDVKTEEIFCQSTWCDPTSGPTSAPTSGPTSGPTSAPTSGPTSAPTSGPTSAPTSGPTSGPTSNPAPAPTMAPVEDTFPDVGTFPDVATYDGNTEASASNPTPAPTKAPVEDTFPDVGTFPDVPTYGGNSESSAIDTGSTGNSAGSNGDPHFKTWQKEHFEFHGQCDLILAKDAGFADGLGLNVQIRTKLVRYWSYIKSAAILIGDDVLEVQGTNDVEPELSAHWINFEYGAKPKSIGGFPLTIYDDKVPGHPKRRFEIDLNSKYPGQKIIISTFKEFIKVDFISPSAESYGNTVGMLGDFKSGKTLSRDQATIIHDFNEYGIEWQVLPADDMLFHDPSHPQFPAPCVLPEDPRGQRRRHLGEQSITLEQAEATCAASLSDPLDVKDCVYDILATQDLDMVGAF